MPTGRVKWYDATKGFGFVTSDEGGDVFVPKAALHLSHLGMTADALAGDRFAEGKAAAIKEYGVRWFVGDHVGDMVAATAAGITGIGVTTGPCSATELTGAGATYVLGDLTAFPALLRRIAVGSAGAGR